MAAQRGHTSDAEEQPSGRTPAGEAGGHAGHGGRRPRLSRRSLLIGGGTVVGLGTAGLVARDELSRWWWRIPGNEKPRTPGAVDHPGAQWVAADDANLRRADRPADYPIDRVVLHVVQGSYAVALKVFQDPEHGAAAHYVVRAEDGRIAQTIRELDVGYHAGNMSYNQRSIGIEHEGFVDRPEDFTDVMYASSAKLTAGICGRYDIPVDRQHIVGHHEVPGADHTDPGPHWDWEKYLRLVRAAAAA